MPVSSPLKRCDHTHPKKWLNFCFSRRAVMSISAWKARSRTVSVFLAFNASPQRPTRPSSQDMCCKRSASFGDSTLQHRGRSPSPLYLALLRQEKRSAGGGQRFSSRHHGMGIKAVVKYVPGRRFLADRRVFCWLSFVFFCS